MNHTLNFLPGQFRIVRGCWRDYRTLARFHYRPGHPRTWSQIWIAQFRAPGQVPRVAAVAVLSHPMRLATGRRRALGLRGTLGDDLRFINRHLRTISRVIVHPQFRGLGLSTRLVRCVCKHCDTRYVEALAMMGRSIPFFERAGMKRFDPPARDSPVYYLFDRNLQGGHRPPFQSQQQWAMPTLQKETLMQNLEPRHSLDRVEPNWKADSDFRETQCLEPGNPPLSARQLAFIDDCLQTSDPIDVVMSRFGLSARRLAEWIANSQFVFRLYKTHKSLATRRRGLVIGVQSATWHRRAVLTLMRLSRDVQARERACRDRRPLDALMHELDPNKGRHQREFRRLMRKLQSR